MRPQATNETTILTDGGKDAARAQHVCVCALILLYTPMCVCVSSYYYIDGRNDAALAQHAAGAGDAFVNAPGFNAAVLPLHLQHIHLYISRYTCSMSAIHLYISTESLYI